MDARGWLTGFVLVCSFGAETLRAAEHKVRKSWEWTAAERLVARRDAQSVGDDHTTLKVPVPRFFIDGRRRPELFMSHELMAFLLGTAPADRRGHDAVILSLGWDPAVFWRDLESASAEHTAISRAAAGNPTLAQDRAMCAARFDALTAMRTRYRRFDEFLYVAIATENALVSDTVPSEQWLLWLEEGCR